MIIVLFCIISVINTQECTTTIKGIFSKQISEFERSINQLRNEVAQARRLNHKGQFEYAANMQITSWSIGLARGAQNCAERCPDSLSTCKNLQGDFGILFYQRTVESSGVEWNPKYIVNKWMENPQNNEQLVIANIAQFGCGRAIKRSADRYLEYIVCFFDKAPQNGKEAYVVANEKSIAKACRFGRSNQYSGLCATSYNKMLIMEPQHISRIIEKLPDQVCNITAKGISSKQASQFEIQLNKIRNEVALGRRANHKGQIECASDLHQIVWSKEMAKNAQQCSETCPEYPIFCRNLKGLQTFLIHKQIVHTNKWEFDPEFILDELMQQKTSAQQLLQSMLFQIGCGRSLTPIKDKYLVYTICYFDYPNKIDAYQQSSCLHVGNLCKLGLSNNNIGLCISPYIKDNNFIQVKQISKIIESK